MSPLLKPRAAVLLAGSLPPSSETADRWVIALRWIAIAGMLGTVLVGRILVPDLAIAPLLVVLGLIAAGNVAWTVAVARTPPPPEGRSFVVPQIALDVVALAAMLWFSGGVGNPFAGFLAFQIVLAGLLCSARATVGIVVLVLLSIGALWFAEPLPLATAPGGGEAIRRVGDLVSVTAVSAFLGFFVFVFVQRLQQLREESVRNERLAMLGRLVGGMSHELNTPLATILLASKDLAEVGAEVGAPDVAQLSRTIAAEAQRASDIIGLMRGHVRPDVRSERIELAAFVAELAARELDRLGFDGERAVRTRDPVHVQAVPAGLGQVLANVLKNAVEATAGAPERRIDVAVTVERGRPTVVVQDSGPGIGAEVLSRLGEPFQTTKAGEGGMGLGLYVSSVLAKRMDAVLHVESPRGGGTRVTLVFRRRSAAQATA